ncbi:MAG: MBL fold metallo-hydrolase [Sphingobacteriales bacterium]|nr:MAG: MBL fold metallo-hydrolase [Sphingobacteriales bacterium]
MKKLLLPFLFCFLSVLSKAQYGEYDTVKAGPPFKIFDNLYYVGNDFVSSYLLVTDEGLVLLDATYGKYPVHILQSVKELGFDPMQIKYIFCTHAHYDHFEGADTLQKITHARVGMTDYDWKVADGTIYNEYASKTVKMKRDWTINDGDSLKLGNNVLHFYVTPGHTPGVLSLAFKVYDGKKSYTAFMFGGIGQNFTGVKQTQLYLNSVNRLLKMKNLSVNITNHPGAGNIFEKAEKLKNRKPNTQHPFVDAKGFKEWLLGLKKDALKKLKLEHKKSQMASQLKETNI